VNPLRSRKVQVALATIVACYLAEWGLDVSEGVLAAVIASGVAVILGIAHEDAGTKRAGGGVPLKELMGITPAELREFEPPEPIAPAVGAAVRKAIEPLSKLLREQIDERRKAEKAKHSAYVNGHAAGTVNGKASPPGGP